MGSHATRQGTLSHSHLSSLSRYGMILAYRVELVCASKSLLKKKKKKHKQGMNCLENILPKFWHARKKPAPLSWESKLYHSNQPETFQPSRACGSSGELEVLKTTLGHCHGYRYRNTRESMIIMLIYLTVQCCHVGLHQLMHWAVWLFSVALHLHQLINVLSGLTV